MIYIYYVFLALISLPITVLGLILAPILPLFASNEYGWCDNHSYEDFEPRLPKWLSTFMTPDNSLYGDATFISINGKSYLSMVKWLLRNPAYSFALRYLDAPYMTTVAGDKTIKDNDNAKKGWLFVRANGLFQFVWIIPIGFQRCFMVNLGWNIRALVDDNVFIKPNPYQATFVFSPRLSGYR